MHLDETIWKNPEEFRPERFLNSDRKLDLKLDKSIPFGLGRRVCAGETFARNTLFLYMVALVQNYKFVSPKGYHIPDIKQERRTELISSLPDFWVECIPR